MVKVWLLPFREPLATKNYWKVPLKSTNFILCHKISTHVRRRTKKTQSCEPELVQFREIGIFFHENVPSSCFSETTKLACSLIRQKPPQTKAHTDKSPHRQKPTQTKALCDRTLPDSMVLQSEIYIASVFSAITLKKMPFVAVIWQFFLILQNYLINFCIFCIYHCTALQLFWFTFWYGYMILHWLSFFKALCLETAMNIGIYLHILISRGFCQKGLLSERDFVTLCLSVYLISFLH